MKILYRTGLVLLVFFSLASCGRESYFEDQETGSSAGSEEAEKAGSEISDQAGSRDSTGTARAENETVSGNEENGTVNSGPKLASSTEAAGQIRSQNVIFVDIAGAVNAPGVYEMPVGSRLFQLIEKAGGLTEEADLTILNRAMEITDGQKIYVLSQEEVLSERESASSSELTSVYSAMASNGSEKPESNLNSSADGRIDLNTATKEQLLSLPGIGEQKAEAILSYREERGRFSSTEELKNISGIKDGVYQKIAERIFVR